MVIGVAYAISGSITPLSSKEQAALLTFAKHGGAVIIFADNSDFQDADNSVLAALASVQPANWRKIKPQPG